MYWHLTTFLHYHLDVSTSWHGLAAASRAAVMPRGSSVIAVLPPPASFVRIQGIEHSFAHQNALVRSSIQHLAAIICVGWNPGCAIRLHEFLHMLWQLRVCDHRWFLQYLRAHVLTPNDLNSLSSRPFYIMGGLAAAPRASTAEWSRCPSESLCAASCMQRFGDPCSPFGYREPRPSGAYYHRAAGLGYGHRIPLPAAKRRFLGG